METGADGFPHVIVDSKPDISGNLAESPGFWDKGQPNPNAGNCLRARNYGQERGLLWEIVDCSQLNAFMCRKRCAEGEFT